MDRFKFRVFSSSTLGIYLVPSESFSLVFHDTGNLVQLWAGDGLVDEFPACEIMQFTGLKDGKGKEICEGDICRDKQNQMHTIKYHAPYAAFMAFSDYFPVPQMLGDWLEVIGNIYENSELLNR